LVEKRKSFYLELLVQPWSRELFQAYCRRLTAGKLYPNVPGRVAPAAIFFEELDRSFAGIGDVTSDALLDIFGPEHLRRNGTVISFLAEALSLQISVARLVEVDGKRRLKAVKASIVDAPWGKALGDYEKYLRHKKGAKPLSDRTISSYLRVGAALFASTGKGKSEAIIQKDIAKFVQYAPGAAASLTAFIGYLRSEFSATLQAPKVRKNSHEKREKRLVESVRDSLETLRRTDDLSEAKAHLVRLLSRLYGYRLKDVLGVRKTDVKIMADRIVLKVLPDEEPQEIRGEIMALARPWLERVLSGDSTSPFLFEGRTPMRPMDAAGLVYHNAG
jgi:hypothetical protein